jgi:pimeloyl-ACP methyl ester carboxylesterase
MTEKSGVIARSDGGRLAWRQIAGSGPCVLWLGGFGSDMAGTKAQALADWAIERGRAFVRFDYFGHGESSGELAQGTIGRWREDALAVLDELVEGPAVLVGSSMGGWIACLLALARPERVKAMVLIAPAADFTERLMRPALPPEALEAIRTRGVWVRPSPYEPGGLPIGRALLEDGARWSILPGPLDIHVPLRILQGGRDQDVPWRHALSLYEAIRSEDAVFSLIRDGDHRLSRPQDLTRLRQAVEEAARA